ncbi:MAG TPA: hypothetical protein VLS96_04335 [Nodosilinea sp.]|nr:hypothetical protein [Nodosilinea sp.]
MRAQSEIAPSASTPRFLGLWVGANLVGGFVIGLLESNGLQFMATLVLTGAVVGTAQWLVLKPQGGFRWWPLASALGWIVSTLAVASLGGVYQPVANLLWQTFGLWEVFWLNLVRAPLAVVGMALAQGWLLQRHGRFAAGQAAPTLWGWLGVSVLGAALQGAVSATLCALLCAVLPSLLVGLVNGLGWAAYGLVTGIWLIRQRAGREESL